MKNSEKYPCAFEMKFKLNKKNIFQLILYLCSMKNLIKMPLQPHKNINFAKKL